MDTNLLDELKLLKRIIYKNRNQHRHANYFQKLTKANRSLNSLCSKLRFLEHLATESEPNQELHFKKVVQLQVQCLVEAEKARNRIIYACQAFSGLLSKGWFLSFGSIALASLSRFEPFCEILIPKILSSYEKNLREWLSFLRSNYKDNENRDELVLEVMLIIENSLCTLSSNHILEKHRTSVPESITFEDDVGDPVIVHSAVRE